MQDETSLSRQLNAKAHHNQEQVNKTQNKTKKRTRYRVARVKQQKHTKDKPKHD